MSPALRISITIVLFAATVFAVIWKPRGLHEAWATGTAALVFLVLGFVSPEDAWTVIMNGKPVLLFLLSLLSLATLVDASGFFSWAALHAARAAQGSAKRLFRNVFLLGSAVTFVLSLDTTAVLLTPIVLSFCRRLKIPALPYVVTCALVANAASLALPASNLTNLLLLGTSRISTATYMARMAMPQLVVLAALYVGLAHQFRRELAVTFAEHAVAEPRTAVSHAGYFRASVLVLVISFALFSVGPALGIAPYVVGLMSCALLALYGMATKQVTMRLFRKIPVGMVPFVIGLFLCVKALENLGFAAYLGRLLAAAPYGTAGEVFSHTIVSAVLANASNNLPAALLFQSILNRANEPAMFATLLGVNVGPNVFPFASLATMLVLALARADNATVTGRDFFAAGIRITPLCLLLGAAVLAASYGLVPP